MTLQELGDATDSEFDQQHSCQDNRDPDSDLIVHCSTAHDAPANRWQLHMLHRAEEEEVAMGEAEYEGEITYHSMLEIRYCPFCGQHL